MSSYYRTKNACLGMVVADRDDFERMAAYGTEGSMPGPEAFELLKALNARNYPVFRIMLGRDEIGFISLTAVPGREKTLTTTTYIRPGFHTPELSRTLKESARYAAKTAGFAFVVRVDPANEAAVESMKKVWPDSHIEEDADGTLLYSTDAIVREHNPEATLVFRRGLTKLLARTEIS